MSGAPGGIGATLRQGNYGRILEALSKLPGGFDLKLPQIVVVGQESHGKSSVMERIAMRAAFPRARGFCTRMPIRMKMMHRPHESRIRVRCIYSATGATAKYRQGDGSEVEAVLDIECLSVHQDDVQNTCIQTIISQFIMQIHGRDDGESVLTDIEIEIEIRACNVPDLELVDLPGILYGNETLQGQTESLTRAYLRKPHTLVLCVIDGNSPR